MRKKKIIQRIDQTLDFYQATLNSNIKSVKTELVVGDLEILRSYVTNKPKEKCAKKIKFKF